MGIQKIAVTTDFSEYSRRTFYVAASLASRFSAQLCLVHHAQLTLFTPPPVPLDTERYFEAMRGELRNLACSHPAFEETEVRPLMVKSGTIRSFATSLKEAGIDLVVMATHGRSTFKRLLLGSFTDKVIRFVSCPVLVFRDPDPERAVMRDFSPSRILVPYDVTNPDAVALNAARDWTEAFSAKSRIVSVIDSERGTTGFEVDLLGGWTEYQERILELASRSLEALASDQWRGLHPEIVVTRGHPVEEILAQARDFSADLIVLGTHDRSGLEGVWLGSVADMTTRKASCPVLVVRE